MKTVIRSLALCSLLAAAGTAFGADKVCKLEISGTDQMQYDKKELAVAADCTQWNSRCTMPASCPRRRWDTTGC